MKDTRLFENYKKFVNRRNVILLAVAGSELTGTNDKNDSDRDEMGVCLESLPDLVGFKRFDKPDIYRTAVDRTGIHDTKSEPGDIDLTLYGMRHYLHLALGGNPNLVALLFTPKNKLLIQTELGTELQALAPKIVSKTGINAFLGYMQAQRLRLVGSQGQKRVNRPELEAVYGYDTKYAAHVIRLGYQAKELLYEGKLTFPFDIDRADVINDIKQGRRKIEWVLDYAARLENDIKSLLNSSILRQAPDYDAVEKWMLETYLKIWEQKNESNHGLDQEAVPATS